MSRRICLAFDVANVPSLHFVIFRIHVPILIHSLLVVVVLVVAVVVVSEINTEIHFPFGSQRAPLTIRLPLCRARWRAACVCLALTCSIVSSISHVLCSFARFFFFFFLLLSGVFVYWCALLQLRFVPHFRQINSIRTGMELFFFLLIVVADRRRVRPILFIYMYI